MNYYTSTIPLPLAEKLKEKGMPMMPCFNITQTGSFSDDGGIHFYYNPTFGACFDWLLDKHETFVYVTCLRMDEGWQYCGGIWGFGVDMTLGWKSSWHEAANAAIEKALTLI